VCFVAVYVAICCSVITLTSPVFLCVAVCCVSSAACVAMCVAVYHGDISCVPTGSCSVLCCSVFDAVCCKVSQ